MQVHEAQDTHTTTTPASLAPSKKTSDHLTKFEFVRIVGMRILQLNTLGNCVEDPRRVAFRELLEGTNPTVIRRRLPDGTHEDRLVRDLKLGTHLRRICTSA